MALTQAPQPARQRQSPLKVLRYRDFRLLWISLLVSAVGTWMQIIAQGLLVLQLTHGSALALGIVSLAQALAFFTFAFIGGFIADRVDKRRLLLVTQTLSLLLAAALGTLTITGIVQVWMIVALAFASGAVLSFDQPTRNSLIPLLVPPADLFSAISLQSVVFNGASVFGPALAGATITAFSLAGHAAVFTQWLPGTSIQTLGFTGNFYLNAVSYLAVLFALYALRVPHEAQESSRERRGTLYSNVADALRTVRADQVLPWALLGYGMLLFLGPSPALMLPIFATNILHLSDIQYGLLFSASGVGTVTGGLVFASLSHVLRKGYLLLISMLVWSAALIAFALSAVFGLSLLFLFIFGIAQNGVGATTITLLQMRVPPQMRGRVMSLSTLLNMGIRPLGDFPAGALITAIGAPLTVIGAAALVGIVGVYLTISHRALRQV